MEIAQNENRTDIKQDDGTRLSKQDDEEARLEEHKKVIDQKASLRRSNLNPERPDANYLRTLDSSIKRNTTVIKKLKIINDEQKDGLMDELKSVNLSKFVNEAVSYICEAKLRSADIQAAVQEELDKMAKNYPDRFKVYYVLNQDIRDRHLYSLLHEQPPEIWNGGVGFVSKEMIKAHCPAPAEDIQILGCGPPPMNKAMTAHLEELGYTSEMKFQF